MEREEAARLAERFGPAVYRLAYARTANAADAEDVTQDVFLRLITKAPAFADDEHARAWLLRVTANRASDLFRDLRRRRQVPLEAAGEQPAQEREAGGEALAAVLALPPKLRAAVHLFYYEGLSTAQIARLLRLTETAVRARLSRARALLRQSELLKGGEERV